jgi:hypothetical protein
MKKLRLQVKVVFQKHHIGSITLRTKLIVRGNPELPTQSLNNNSENRGIICAKPRIV